MRSELVLLPVPIVAVIPVPMRIIVVMPVIRVVVPMPVICPNNIVVVRGSGRERRDG